jgi:hypothetical protein
MLRRQGSGLPNAIPEGHGAVAPVPFRFISGGAHAALCDIGIATLFATSADFGAERDRRLRVGVASDFPLAIEHSGTVAHRRGDS